MNNIENNKLITEFMGNIIRDNIVYFPMLQECTIDELEYDTSWKWLMPVVEEIWRIIGKRKSLFYFEVDDELTIYGKEEPSMDNNKSNCYSAVIEFIKWYNKNECLCKNPTIQKNTKQCGKCKLYIDKVKHILLTQNNNHEK
jgi:hypothetical protein